MLEVAQLEMIHVIGAALAIGLSGFGVGLGEGRIGRVSMNILGKNPELGGTLLVYTILGIALVESAAIYGLIIAFNIAGSESLTWAQGIAAGLAVGLPGLAVSLGESYVVTGALKAYHRNPEIKGKILTYMILFVALVESAAIYGLIMAFNILG